MWRRMEPPITYLAAQVSLCQPTMPVPDVPIQNGPGASNGCHECRALLKGARPLPLLLAPPLGRDWPVLTNAILPRWVKSWR